MINEEHGVEREIKVGESSPSYQILDMRFFRGRGLQGFLTARCCTNAIIHLVQWTGSRCLWIPELSRRITLEEKDEHDHKVKDKLDVLSVKSEYVSLLETCPNPGKQVHRPSRRSVRGTLDIQEESNDRKASDWKRD